MGSEALLSNRKASQIFFLLVRGRARPAGLARRLGMSRTDCDKLIARMKRAGVLQAAAGGALEIDWERFVPVFVSQAMNIYSAAMPWKFVPYYVERDPDNVIEAACARAERELAKVKVKLTGSDLFLQLVRDFFATLATEVDAPEDYLADLRIQDAVDEFEYALLKLYPLVRRAKGKDAAAKALTRLLGDWYRQIQDYDNTPTGAALRRAFERTGLI